MVIDCENEQTIRESMKQQGMDEKDIEGTIELIKTIRDTTPEVLKKIEKRNLKCKKYY